MSETQPGRSQLGPRRALACWLLGLILTSTALGQTPAQDPMLSPEEVLTRVAQAMSQKHTNQRLTIVVSRDGMDDQQGVVDVWVQREPASNEGGAGPVESLRLAFGSFRVQAEGGRVVCVHEDDPVGVLAWDIVEPFNAEAIAQELGPLPTGFVDLLLGGSGDADWSRVFEPFVWPVRWAEVQKAPDDAALIQVLGFGPDGPAKLTIDPSNDQLVQFEASISHQRTIQIGFEAIPPATWTISLANRIEIPSLHQFGRLTSVLHAGDVCDELALRKDDQSLWVIASRADQPDDTNMADPAASEGEPAEQAGQGSSRSNLAIVFFRAADARLTHANRIGQSIKAMHAIDLAQEQLNEHRLVGVSTIVYQLSDYSTQAYRSAADQWLNQRLSAIQQHNESSATDRVKESLFWTESPEKTIDRFSKRSALVLVILNNDHRVLGIKELGAELFDEEQVQSLSTWIVSLFSTPPHQIDADDKIDDG